MGPGIVEINNQQFKSNLIFGQNFVFHWEIANQNQLTFDDFLFLKFVRPIPEYIIICD